MNPILPNQFFIPDVEARQWSDGRMYLYGSLDIPGDTDYCSREYRVFSSADLHQWTDHGISFRSSDSHTGKVERLFAPDCTQIAGRYALCYCGSDNSEGIALSDHPAGPFTHARAVAGADGDAIDPAIFVDDDGSIYYFWGQFNLRGARLKPDLSGIDPATLNTSIITESEHGFHEGASIRKRHGIYYLAYTDISRGRATCIGYATSPSPLGPYTKRGIIIDNTGCDPQTWNNHGSIAQFNDAWYVFYHRSSQAGKFNRRVCAEPISFTADGTIPEVEMTTQGISKPLPAAAPVDACRACLLSGRTHTGIRYPQRDEPWHEYLTMIHNRDHAAYKYLDFGHGAKSFHAVAASGAYGGTIEVRLDSPNGTLLATCDVPATGGWSKWIDVTAAVSVPVRGVHAVYLVFRGDHSGRLFDLSLFRFV